MTAEWRSKRPLPVSFFALRAGSGLATERVAFDIETEKYALEPGGRPSQRDSQRIGYVDPHRRPKNEARGCDEVQKEPTELFFGGYSEGPFPAIDAGEEPAEVRSATFG